MSDVTGASTPSESGPQHYYFDLNEINQNPNPGLHPHDPAEVVGPNFGRGNVVPVGTDNTNRYTKGDRPFHTENKEALPVFERSAQHWTVRTIQINASNGGTAIAVGKQKGRKSVTLSVPYLVPGTGTQNQFSVTYAPEEGDLQNGNTCGVIPPPSLVLFGANVTLHTEDAIWVGLGTDNTGAPATVGYVTVVTEINPSDGGIL